MKQTKVVLAASVAVIASAGHATACDLCSIYFATQARGESGTGFVTGAAEQWTHYGTLQDDGHEVPNDLGQYLDSSISQLLVGYNFTERVGLQVNLPVIARWFRRPSGLELENGTESGIGDASLLGRFVAYRHQTEAFTFNCDVLGGIKFPTGSTRRLREETDEEEIPGAPASGIHGHDLTLGSGSWDGIVGGTLFARWHRLFWAGNLQYSIRSEGDYDYQFANDLIWMTGPGVFLALGHDYTAGLQLTFSGETKGKDTFRGIPAEDTGITAFYLGPQLSFTWTQKLSAELAVDVPVSLDNTALQAVPDYRIRAGISWHF